MGGVVGEGLGGVGIQALQPDVDVVEVHEQGTAEAAQAIEPLDAVLWCCHETILQARTRERRLVVRSVNSSTPTIEGFQPHFDPRFLVFPDEAALPRMGLALSRATCRTRESATFCRWLDLAGSRRV